MNYSIRSIVIPAFVCSLTSIVGAQTPPAARAGQAAPPAVRLGPASSDNRLATVPGFTVDHPKRDWNLLVGVGSAMVVFVHKSNEATVAIERMTIPIALAPSDIIDETAKEEMQQWQLRRPYATSFSYQFQEYAGSKFIIVDFTQPGPKGAEHGRLYTLFGGTTRFRVVCTTTQPTFDKYKETLHRIAMSLHPTASQ